jgi:hypothetical protein
MTLPGPATSRLYDLGRAILDALYASWPGDAEPLPERAYVHVGLPAFDCEEVVVALETTMPHSGFVEQELFLSQQANAGWSMRAARFSIWIVRCVPGLDENGSPSDSELDLAAQALAGDPVAIINVLTAAQLAGSITGCDGIAFEEWAAVGPEGGMGGGAYRIRVNLF